MRNTYFIFKTILKYQLILSFHPKLNRNAFLILLIGNKLT